MTTPRCPYCNAQGIKNLAHQAVELYGIVYCRACGAIHGVVPLPPAQKPETRVVQPEPLPHHSAPSDVVIPERQDPVYLVELGNKDLSEKVPYSPEHMAARLRAAGRTAGRQYLRVAVEDGPPVCLQCKMEMEPVRVPTGYQNAGVQLWICPHYEQCRQWEWTE